MKVEYYLLNGEIKSWNSLNDINVHPKSVYEVIKIIDRKPLFYEDHFDRFERSVVSLGYPVNFTVDGVLREIKTFLSINKLRDVNVKLLYTPSPVKGRFDFLVYQSGSAVVSSCEREKGVLVETVEIERENPNTKTIGSSYKDRIRNSKYPDTFELLLLNREGFITEGSRSNVFFSKGGSLITPPGEKVLLGVTRKHILNICKREGVEVRFDNIKYDQLTTMDGAFLSGTTIDILPIRQIDDIPYKKSGLLSRLMTLYKNTVDEYLKNFEAK